MALHGFTALLPAVSVNGVDSVVRDRPKTQMSLV